MLQFITHPCSKYSVAEEIRMVIEGGCRWVQIRMKDASDNEVRRVAEDVIPLCQETGTILVLDDRVEVTMELRVHGVHLGKNDMPPSQAREYLGPHAIIGATANTSDDILALRELDIDYVGLGPFRFTQTKKNLSPVIGLDGYRTIVDTVRAASCDLPIVAIGGIGIDDVEPVMSTGVNGIAVSGSIINADDPVAYTARIIDKLNEISK